MAKPHTTRTFAPLHFEDLEPHRFEDLIRQLVYELKEWQSIEGTGRSGSDEGYDIRAFEKVSKPVSQPDEEGENEAEAIHPMEGRLWMIQCKREPKLGSSRIKQIIHEGVSATNPPYGYILAAPANFSKAAYDTFRDELRSRGVMEFHLWGRAELEDMLSMPRFDNILFAYFGISYATRRRTKTTEVRNTTTIKNKIYRTIASLDSTTFNEEILIRDINAEDYPFEDEYPDFKENPKSIPCYATQYAYYGVVVTLHKYVGLVDRERKVFDYYEGFDEVNILNEVEKHEHSYDRFLERTKIKSFQETFPINKQVTVTIMAVMPFDEVLLVDAEGDAVFQIPHFYMEFKKGLPFRKLFYFLDSKGPRIDVQNEEFSRIHTLIPKEIPESKLGNIYKEHKAELDKYSIRRILSNDEVEKFCYVGNEFDYLMPNDVLFLKYTEGRDQRSGYAKITCRYEISLEEYLSFQNGNRTKENAEAKFGVKLKKNSLIKVLELKSVSTYLVEIKLSEGE